VKSNIRTKSVLKIKIIKPEIPEINPFVNQNNYKVIEEPEYTSEAETETTTKPRLVIGIETLLDTMSIALQNGRESNQEGLSKQTASATPPLIKPPQSQWQQRIQDFKNQIKMPPEGTENIHNTPPRETENMQSASPYNIGSQQTLYLKKILTREPRKEWEEFNS